MTFTSTWRRSETQSLRGLGALVVTALAAMSIAVMAVVFLWPSIPDTSVYVGRVEALPLRQPIFYADHNFWVVKLDEKTVIALSNDDPRPGNCRVEWLPDFLFNNERGWFREACFLSTYDLAGNRIYGPTPRGLDRYEVRIETSGSVRVLADERHLTRGPSQSKLGRDEIVRP